MHAKVQEIMANYKNQGEEVVHQDLILLRNYVIFNIFLRNAHRAAGVANLLIRKNFWNAQLVEDCKIQMVGKHNKTNKICGDAPIVINKFL